MGLFKRGPTAYGELIHVCGVLGRAIGECGAGVQPPDYLDFTIQNQAAAFRASYEAYAMEQGNVDKAWKAAEKHVTSIAKIWLETNHVYVNRNGLAQRVTEVLMATIAASASQAAGSGWTSPA